MICVESRNGGVGDRYTLQVMFLCWIVMQVIKELLLLLTVISYNNGANDGNQIGS